MKKAKWVRFDLVGQKAKTKVWDVVATAHEAAGIMPSLGVIQWHSYWRKYAFFPCNSLFESQCLRDIADFLDDAMKEHRSKKAS